ncbi:MAG: alpha/beta hydrolase [bacterium]
MTALTKRPLLPVLAVLTLLPAVSAAGADKAADGAYTIPNSHVLSVRSELGRRDYELYVRLPISYEDEAERRYPVLYLLDAEYSFAIASSIVQHLEERNNLKELILVGVAYPRKDRENYRLNRSRDYTPTHTLHGGYGEKYQRNSGGGETFLKILKTELIPYIEQRFRTMEGERGIAGHSYGGLFATFALTADPSVFNRYIVVSPSYWYDDKVIFRLEAEQAGRIADLPADLFIAVGAYENQPENGRAMVDDVKAFARRLRTRGFNSLDMRVMVLPDETHNTVFPSALSWGLRAHYWRSPQNRDSGG